MFRLVEYFNTFNNGEGLGGPTNGVWYALPYQLPTAYSINTDSNGYKYAYPTTPTAHAILYEHTTERNCPGAYLIITPSTDYFFSHSFTCMFQDTPPSFEDGNDPHRTLFSSITVSLVGSTPAGLYRNFEFIVLQYDSDGFGTMKNGVYLRHTLGVSDSIAWRIIDDFNLTDLYTFELRIWTNRFNIRVLQNENEIKNDTYHFSDYYSSNTDLTSILTRIEIFGKSTDQKTRFYYWEYGLYDIDCSEGESNKLYVDGTVVPNATIYFLDNDSSSGTYQQVIGTAITDADGSYTLPSGVSPPYIAFGTTPSGYGFCVKVDS